MPDESVANGAGRRNVLWLGLVDEAMMDGVESEFKAIGDAKLVEDVVQVIFYGLLADEKFFADFLVAEALGNELNDFFFAVAEERLFAARAGLGRFRESLHDFGGHAIVEPDFAGMNAMNAFHEKVRGGLFEDYAASAEAHGADYVAIVFGGSENDDARGKRIKIYFFEDGEAIFVGHAEIEQENFRLELGEEFDALGAVLRFADDSDVLVGIEKFAKTVAKNGVVIGEEDANLLFSFGHVNRAERR